MQLSELSLFIKDNKEFLLALATLVLGAMEGERRRRKRNRAKAAACPAPTQPQQKQEGEENGKTV